MMPSEVRQSQEEDRVDGPFGRKDQVAALPVPAHEGEHDAPDRYRQSHPEGELPEQDHPAISSGIAS